MLLDWMQGSGAQEEQLYRRSTYPLFKVGDVNPYIHALNSRSQPVTKYTSPVRSIAQTLGTRVEVAEEALVFRGDARDGYPYVVPFVVNFIAQAAWPRQLLGGAIIKKYNKTEKEKMKERIQILINAAVAYHVEYFVAGALGCGAFYHPVLNHHSH